LANLFDAIISLGLTAKVRKVGEQARVHNPARVPRDFDMPATAIPYSKRWWQTVLIGGALRISRHYF
jgi:hypothetical protein